MRWNKRPPVERPQYPKLVAIGAATGETGDLLPLLLASDPCAELVDGGAHGLYARVHNEAAEKAAKMFAENRASRSGDGDQKTILLGESHLGQ